MKKYYIFLSVISVFILAFIGLAIFYYYDYYEITKEIYKLELNHTVTSLIPFFNEGENTTPKERPDTSSLQAEADVSLTLGIIFTVLACAALTLLVIEVIKIINIKKSRINEIDN